MHNAPFQSLSKRHIRYSSLSKQSPQHASNSYEASLSAKKHLNSHFYNNQRLDSLTQDQTQLQRQISSIDVSILKMQARRMFKNGIIFQVRVDYEVACALREMIGSRMQVISWGLIFENQPQPNEEKQFKKGRKLPAIDFSRRFHPLQASRAKQEERLSLERYKQAASLLIDKWQYFSKGATPKYYQHRRRFKTDQAKLSDYLTSDLSLSYEVKDVQKMIGAKSLAQRVRVNYSQIQSPKTMLKSVVLKCPILSTPEIFQLLEKQNKLISIWLPPSANPELIGVMSVLVRQKQDGANLCLIKKYWWGRRLMGRRFFNCMLNWLSNEHGVTDELTLLTGKPLFDDIFGPLGWKITSWMHDQKIRIIYKRVLP